MLVYYKDTDTHNYLHQTSLHPDHCKLAIPYNQFLRFRRICSDDDDFKTRATEMMDHFRAGGYPESQLISDLHIYRVATIPRHETPTPPRLSNSIKVPLVLMYYPFNTGIKQLLDSFNILASDPETCRISSEPPLVAYRQDRNLRDILVHSADGFSSPSDSGSFPCRRPRCHTCKYITSRTVLQGPKNAYNIRDYFTCQSENVVYSI